MRAIRWIPILLLLTLTLEPARAAEPAAVGGHWEGEINLPQNQVLQVKVDLEEASGAWKGTIDIPAQGAKGLPLEPIAVQGPNCRPSRFASRSTHAAEAGDGAADVTASPPTSVRASPPRAAAR